MFSGIVDHIGQLVGVQQKTKGVLFRIRSTFSDFNLGESIAVDGVCLTVTAFENDVFECELSPETLVVTRASEYQVGQQLNLERAMCMGDRIGGHLVTGHVDGLITLDNKKQCDEFFELHFSDFSKNNFSYLIPKGSVTINGVSLTVNAIDPEGFSVMLIPHTLERTNLSALNVGDRVNVEWDYMAKIIERQVAVRGMTV